MPYGTSDEIAQLREIIKKQEIALLKVNKELKEEINLHWKNNLIADQLNSDFDDVLMQIKDAYVLCCDDKTKQKLKEILKKHWEGFYE